MRAKLLTLLIFCPALNYLHGFPVTGWGNRQVHGLPGRDMPKTRNWLSPTMHANSSETHHDVNN